MWNAKQELSPRDYLQISIFLSPFPESQYRNLVSPACSTSFHSARLPVLSPFHALLLIVVDQYGDWNGTAASVNLSGTFLAPPCPPQGSSERLYRSSLRPSLGESRRVLTASFHHKIETATGSQRRASGPPPASLPGYPRPLGRRGEERRGRDRRKHVYSWRTNRVKQKQRVGKKVSLSINPVWNPVASPTHHATVLPVL